MFGPRDGLVLVPFWVAAMAWLVVQDVAPGWTAQEPPTLVASAWLQEEGGSSQCGIFNDKGHRVGTIWTSYLIEEESIRRDELVWLERLGSALGPAGAGLGPLGLRIGATYRVDGVLDEFDVKLRCPVVQAHLHGERFHADFSFEFVSGPLRKAFKLPLSEAGMISAAFNPFEQLDNLHVGQRWRMQVFNPLAAVAGVGDKFIPLLVEVTGRETIEVGEGHMRGCLVVESPGAQAWVDERGVVWVQEVVLPVGGKLRIVRESLDEAAKERARVQYRDMQGNVSGGN